MHIENVIKGQFSPSDWKASAASTFPSPTQFLQDSRFGLVANVTDCDRAPPTKSACSFGVI